MKKNTGKPGTARRIGAIVTAVLFVLSLAVVIGPTPVHAAGTVTDQDGNTYQYLSQAVSSAPEGKTTTLYLNGEVRHGSQNIIVRKNATVKLISTSPDTVINASLGTAHEGAVLIIGEGSTTNKIKVNGRLLNDNGLIETYSELEAESFYPVIEVGYHNCTDSPKMRINGGVFTCGGNGVEVHGTKAEIEYIKDASFTTTIDGDGAICLDEGGRIGSIENTTIAGDKGGIVITDGGNLGTIKNCTISGTRGPGLRVGNGGSFTKTWVDSIENTTITGTTGIWMFGYDGRPGTHEIGELKNVTATGQSGPALSVNIRSIVGKIDGGTYVGATHGILFGTQMNTSQTGEVKSIQGNAVICGKNGYAIQNNLEGGPIGLEPDLTSQVIGNARYGGSRGVIYGPTKDTYPVNSQTGATYTMSTGSVSLPDFTGIEFHYLEVDCEVTYDGNGGTGDMSDKGYRGKYAPDMAITAADNGYTKGDSRFTGWNTKADGSGTGYQPGATIEIKDAKTTLYAQWMDKYDISLDLNEGTLEGQTGTIVHRLEEGTAFTFPAPTREGYTFDYWEGSRHNAGDTINVTENHTYTARWKANEQDQGGDSGDDQGSGDDSSKGKTPTNPAGKVTPANGNAKTGDDAPVGMAVALSLTATFLSVAAASHKRKTLGNMKQ